jgi:hypothetical protein
VVVPLLLEKLYSPRRLTALAAAWAIGKMHDERNLPPLLEAWAKAMNETLRCEAMTAVSMTVRGRKDAWRSIANERVDPDVQSLLEARLCSDAQKPAHQRRDDGGAQQPMVFGDQLNAGYRVSCFAEDAEIFQSRYPPDSMPEEAHGKKYVSFHCDILDLGESPIPMPEWEKRMGERPTSLALVFVWSDRIWPRGTVGGGGGQEALWARCGSTWRRVGVTYACI